MRLRMRSTRKDAVAGIGRAPIVGARAPGSSGASTLWVRARRGARAGASLLEAVFAIAVVAIAVTGVFSVAISTAQTRRSLDPHEDGLEAAESLADRLRLYVTADTSEPSFAPGGSWKLPGDSDNSYALQPNVEHDATKFLPKHILKKSPDASMTYTVTQGAPGEPATLKIKVRMPRVVQ